MIPKPNDTLEYGDFLFRVVMTREEIEAILASETLPELFAPCEAYGIRENRLYRLAPDGTAEACFFTGTKHARQYYADEVEYDGKLHDRLCSFVFSAGEFLPGKSDVVLSDERFITPFVWSEGAEEQDGGLRSVDGRRMYLLCPTGGLMQYEELLARYIAYAHTRKLDRDWVERMKRRTHPVFRMEVMRQDEAGQFVRQVYDLALLAVRFLDAERLGWLSGHLPADVPGYREMLETELAAALSRGETGDADGIREILRRFSETSH